MNNRDVTRSLPNGSTASAESADLIAIAQGKTVIQNEDDEDELDAEIDELFADDLDDTEGYDYSLDGAGELPDR